MPRPTTTQRGYGSQHVRQARAVITRAHRNREPCWRCGGPLYPHLPGTHPLGTTADHDPPLAIARRTGQPTTLRPAHRACNCRHGGQLGARITAATRPARRRW
jgi:hypothetical protein